MNSYFKLIFHCTVYTTNKEIFRIVRETRSFLKTLKIIRAKIVGHILRHNSLPSTIIEIEVKGKNRNSRRPLLVYISRIIKDI